MFRLALVLVVAASLHGPGRASGPTLGDRITRVRIKKGEHVMQLLSRSPDGERTVASYRVAIGPGGPGPKRREGDRVTPVGRYHVTAHQPSRYKFFLRLDYPNDEDRRRFAALKKSGELPASARIGGDVGIHGPPVSLDEEQKARLVEYDWTLGCIALGEAEIIEVARLVRDGTPVDIED